MRGRETGLGVVCGVGRELIAGRGETRVGLDELARVWRGGGVLHDGLGRRLELAWLVVRR